MENSVQLDKITGNVQFMKRVKIKPNQSLKIEARATSPLNTKRVNVIIEPMDDDEGSYTIPAYTYLKPNSKCVGLRNLNCHTVTLHKGMVIAMLSPSNVIPKMLAPKLAKCKLEFVNGETLKNHKPVFADVTNSIPELTQEHREKLFPKLDLSSYDEWTANQQQLIDNLIQHYHHIFAVDDLELGHTDMVKHKIKLDNYIPFKE